MTQPPTFSVVIPAYNQAGFLADAVESVLAQSFADCEIIVVDDGSTDETPAAAARFGSRVCYIRQENGGLAAARNTGIRNARGTFVSLLDSDDAWTPGYLARMRALAGEHPQAAVFFSAARCMDASGGDLSQVMGAQAVQPGELYRALLRANFLIPSTVTIRREVLLQAGLFDQTLPSGCEDWDLWLRLLSAGHAFISTPEPLARYRIHGSSMSTNIVKMRSSKQTVLEKHFGLDDGQPGRWSEEKREAYAGFYRHLLLISIQRQNVWEASYLRQAAQVEPGIAKDVALFYEMALGSQPVGLRGTAQRLNLAENAERIQRLLAEAFGAEAHPLRKEAHATAQKALGLVAYNTGDYQSARQHFFAAIRQQPRLLADKLVAGDFLKSFIKPLLKR